MLVGDQGGEDVSFSWRFVGINDAPPKEAQGVNLMQLLDIKTKDFAIFPCLTTLKSSKLSS